MKKLLRYFVDRPRHQKILIEHLFNKAWTCNSWSISKLGFLNTFGLEIFSCRIKFWCSILGKIGILTSDLSQNKQSMKSFHRDCAFGVNKYVLHLTCWPKFSTKDVLFESFPHFACTQRSKTVILLTQLNQLTREVLIDIPSFFTGDSRD